MIICQQLNLGVFFYNAVCVHGTYKQNLELILQSGLKRMQRLHVHFANCLPTDGEVISGMYMYWYAFFQPVLIDC